jgi:endonuclease/exonuclease/phosphatase family metal-dependent hydrolase
MKLLKSILFFVALLLALLTILISTGSALCKFSISMNIQIIRACGYISFVWIMAVSLVVILLFLLLKSMPIAISYLSLMLLFVLLLFDFSFSFLKNRIPENVTNFDDLKVVAYNVRYYTYGLDNITNFIRESGFDIVLLSENVVDSSKLEYLKANLKDYTILTDNGHDLSLLSKFPVVYYKIVELPTYIASLSGSNDIAELKRGGTHRSFIHAIVDVNGTYVNFLSVRLIAGRPKDKSLAESIRWGEYLLDAQDKELSVFLSYLHTLKGPVIFGGDLNVPPNSDIISEIKQYAYDSYLDNHPFGPLTFKTSLPMIRLDYIFHSKDVIPKKSEVIKIMLSDHFPISAEFLLQKKNMQSMK